MPTLPPQLWQPLNCTKMKSVGSNRRVVCAYVLSNLVRVCVGSMLNLGVCSSHTSQGQQFPHQEKGRIDFVNGQFLVRGVIGGVPADACHLCLWECRSRGQLLHKVGVAWLPVSMQSRSNR
jgi:hypothetical protein